jgi:hypothetical protein
MRLRRHSKSWIPFHNSRRRRSWANSWTLGSHSRSSLRGGIGEAPLPNEEFHFTETAHAGQARPPGLKRGVSLTLATEMAVPVEHNE